MNLRNTFPVLSYYVGKKLQILSTYFYRKNPRKWTQKKYYQKFGIRLNLDNPNSFYEKMNYWKLFSYYKEQDLLTDKIEVKNILSVNGFDDLCTKTYFSCDSIKEAKKWFYINCKTIKKMVIKTSHSCGDVFIYDNGLITKKNGRKIKNISAVFRMLKIGLKFNHYYSRFEQNYKNLEHRIFFEEYIEYDNETIEYEIMCNYGKIRFAQIVFNRQNNEGTKFLVDKDFTFLSNVRGNLTNNQTTSIQTPRDINLITIVIEKLVSKFPFCRVDFVQTKNRTYFCEFTFVKSGGIDAYIPLQLNDYLGSLFKL